MIRKYIHNLVQTRQIELNLFNNLSKKEKIRHYVVDIACLLLITISFVLITWAMIYLATSMFLTMFPLKAFQSSTNKMLLVQWLKIYRQILVPMTYITMAIALLVGVVNVLLSHYFHPMSHRLAFTRGRERLLVETADKLRNPSKYAHSAEIKLIDDSINPKSVKIVHVNLNK